jgi:hypothetical protein
MLDDLNWSFNCTFKFQLIVVIFGFGGRINTAAGFDK